MKLETQTSIEQLPKQISTLIAEIAKRTESLQSNVGLFHPEKIYDSFVKVDEFRRELYEIDLLSQNLMDAYRLYSAFAAQALELSTSQAAHTESPEANGTSHEES